MTASRYFTKKRVYYIVAIGAVVVCIIAASFVYVWKHTPVISSGAVKDASFTVYAPYNTPKNYTLQKDATHLDTGSKTFTYSFRSTTDDKEIVVTVQPPPGISMSQMIEGGSVQQTATDNGTLYDLSVGESSRFLLDTGDSFIFITSSSKIDTVTVNALVADMAKLN